MKPLVRLPFHVAVNFESKPISRCGDQAWFDLNGSNVIGPYDILAWDHEDLSYGWHLRGTGEQKIAAMMSINHVDTGHQDSDRKCRSDEQVHLPHHYLPEFCLIGIRLANR